MKLSDLIAARDQLKNLANMHYVHFSTIRAVANLVKEADVELEFFTKEFREIVNKYADKDKDGKPVVGSAGNFKLSDADKREEFYKAYNDLLSVDIADKVKKITIKESDFKDTKELPTPNELSALDPFVDWVE